GFNGTEIEYTSPMARTQDSSQVQAIERFAGTIASFAEVNPELMKIPDWVEMMTDMAVKMGVSPKLLKNKADIEAETRKERQLQEQMQQGAAMQQMGDGMQSLQQAEGNVANE
ncbi:MAG: hypothetical protein KAJ55_07750, partial [Anaerolineales bacterium]|nr:hypothetical protein [Anaerolineales bacterium]